MNKLKPCAPEYIERAAAVKAVLRERKPENSVAQNRKLAIIQHELVTMPAADVEPVVYGRWVPMFESEISGWNPSYAGYDPIGGYKCSRCGEEAVFDCNNKYVLSPRCHECGARMNVEAKNAST